jgi:hypothetical protein
VQGLMRDLINQAALLEGDRGLGGHTGEPVEQVVARLEPLWGAGDRDREESEQRVRSGQRHGDHRG